MAGADDRDDQVLSLIGNFGRWQFIICLIIAIPGMVSGWQILVRESENTLFHTDFSSTETTFRR